MRFRIALVQMNVLNDQPDANLARFEELLREAAESGAELVVFPENCLSGVGVGITERADTDGSYRETMRRLAAAYGVDLIPGSQPERESDGRTFNTTYYIDRGGAVLARYRKVHLWVSEKAYATPGEGAAVADTRFGRVGLAICWDLAFPELFREMFRRRAEIVVCPACWCLEDAGSGQRHDPNAEQSFIDACCTARAFENEMVLVFCNAAGAWEGSRGLSTSAGHTQVAVPFLGAAARLDDNGEAILVHEVDTAILAEAERSYEIRKDLLGHR